MMISKHTRWILGAVLLLSLSLPAGAASSGESSELKINTSNRMANRLGGYIGILGDPFPTIIGINLAYNVFDFMRATAGFGKVGVSAGNNSISATTLGAGVRFFVPNWSLSPVAGLSFAHLSVSRSGDVGTLDIHGINDNTSLFYANVGMDWQAHSGFNVGLGYNLPFKSGVGGAPYLNLGWFFDWV